MLNLKFSIGIDPGKKGGIALIDSEGKLSYLGGFWGQGDPWLARVSGCFEDVCQVLTYHRNSRGPLDLRMVMEKPPSWSGGGARTAAGLARRAGAIEALLWVAELDIPLEQLAWNAWPGLAGVRAGKVGAGEHRIEEASRLVPGAGAWLESLPAQAGRVDCAEAVLIALAGWRRSK